MPDGIINETPQPTQSHVKNYMELLGAVLKNYRKTHPIIGVRSTEVFAKKRITPYFEKNVHRTTISNAEKGKHEVSFGVYAAILQEMGVWPEIIESASSGKVEDMRYARLVVDELRKKEVKKNKERLETLHQQYFRQIG